MSIALAGERFGKYLSPYPKSVRGREWCAYQKPPPVPRSRTKGRTVDFHSWEVGRGQAYLDGVGQIVMLPSRDLHNFYPQKQIVIIDDAGLNAIQYE